MTKEEAINILQNIDPQCQKDCPVSRDVCAKQENRCLVSDALEYAVDFLSNDVVEVKRGHWIEEEYSTEDDWGVNNYHYHICSECHERISNKYFSKSWVCCPYCKAVMGGVEIDN